MALFLYIMVLIFETIYYSLFIKLSKQEGQLSRYLLTFSIITLVGVVIKTNTMFSYISLILMIICGLKYIVKVHVSLFDMLIILLMLLTKLILELPVYIVCYNNLDTITTGAICGLIKIGMLVLARNVLHKIYKKLYKLWINNNFYIRYTFTIIMFTYIIVSSVFIVFYYI